MRFGENSSGLRECEVVRYGTCTALEELLGLIKRVGELDRHGRRGIDGCKVSNSLVWSGGSN